MALSLAGSEALHEPGDSLGVLPRNDPLEVEAVLDAVGLGADATLSEAMATHYDITTLTMPQLVSYAALSGTEALAQLVADEGRAAEFLADRQLIDLLTAHPCLLSADQLTGLLRRLQPRLYSIASSRKVVPDQVHLLIAGLQYEAHGRLRSGVASMDLIERRAVGEQVRVYIKRNPHFRLPSDPERSIIMIGPGTGLAPFRAFMQERSAMGATGRSWLFFGHRHQAGDFFYEAEWQDLRKRGVLTRLDLGFSRDQPQKIYVQDRMWEARHDLFAWLEGGAALYVCGNASSMARGVNAMLVRIAADQGSLREPDAQAWLDRLRREGRYLRDVY
jgi:sulfite reductase (NADPH) flavoprotein alpha-component